MRRSFRLRQWVRLLALLAGLALFFDMMYFYAPQSFQIALVVLKLVGEVALYAFILVFQFIALFWFLARGRMYWINPGETGFTWDDYRGNPDVRRLANHIVTLLQGVQEFKEMGGEATRGLLLVGPPGTGKSYLAQVIANEAGVPFCYASAPSFQNMFFGVSNLKVMGLYRRARKKALEYGACIVFIDEIDAIGAKRGQGSGGSLFGAGAGLLNELLLQMDPPNIDNSWIHKLLRSLGLRKRKAERPVVLTIGATNLPDTLDQALLRPGRFDKQIVIDAPDFDGRADVIKYYLSKVKASPAIEVQRMALDTVGYTPAQLKHVINEAVIVGHAAGFQTITYDHFRRAMEAYEWGLRQPIKNMPERDRRRLAYHEAGHAVAQYLLQPDNHLWKVTIVRHGSALGLSASKPKGERYLESAADLRVQMQVCLAARAAEELFLEEQLGGVTGDLKQATRLAFVYLGAAGMGDEYYSWLAPGSTGEGVKALRPKINRLLREQMESVKALLLENQEFSHAVATALLEREELTGDEVDQIYQSLAATAGRA